MSKRRLLRLVVFIRQRSRALGGSARPALGLVLVLSLLLTVGMRVAHAAMSTPELPNLVADAPTNVTLETSTTEGGL